MLKFIVGSYVRIVWSDPRIEYAKFTLDDNIAIIITFSLFNV